MTFLYLAVFVLISFFIFSFLLFIFSSIPFYPTNKKDLPLIVKALLKKKNSLIVDLGAGTGTVIFAAASEAYKKNLSIKFLALEIHPLLVLIMRLRRLFHPNRKQITIKRADIFGPKWLSSAALTTKNGAANARPHSLGFGDPKVELAWRAKKRLTIEEYNELTIYLYLNPQSLKKLKPELTKLTKGSMVVSYMYDIPGWEKKLTKTKRGENKIFIYRI